MDGTQCFYIENSTYHWQTPGEETPDKILKISCIGSEIEQVTSQKQLGEKLVSHLNFTEHIEDLCKKVSQRIAVLKKIKRNFPLTECKLCFNVLIKPIVLYRSCAWSTVSEENVKRVSKLQGRTDRVIWNTDIGERREMLLTA